MLGKKKKSLIYKETISALGLKEDIALEEWHLTDKHNILEQVFLAVSCLSVNREVKSSILF